MNVLLPFLKLPITIILKASESIFRRSWTSAAAQLSMVSGCTSLPVSSARAASRLRRSENS